MFFAESEQGRHSERTLFTAKKQCYVLISSNSRLLCFFHRKVKRRTHTHTTNVVRGAQVKNKRIYWHDDMSRHKKKIHSRTRCINSRTHVEIVDQLCWRNDCCRTMCPIYNISVYIRECLGLAVHFCMNKKNVIPSNDLNNSLNEQREKISTHKLFASILMHTLIFIKS